MQIVIGACASVDISNCNESARSWHPYQPLTTSATNIRIAATC